MLKLPTVNDIRVEFARLLANQVFVQDKSGVKCIEIQNAAFIADEPIIFGKDNQDYIQRELGWYLSQSLYVDDIPEGSPEIWKKVSCNRGSINSNYGWCIFSIENGLQFYHALRALSEDKNTRRSIMIYTRPEMQVDFKEDGMSDFMCTTSVQYMIRDGKLHSYVSMRSNDAVFGYKNDYAFQSFVLNMLYAALKPVYPDLEIGYIHWNAVSLHVYERHFNFVEDFTRAHP